MSPPDSNGLEKSAPSDDSLPKQELDSLGEALAGVSLHSQPSGAYGVSTALATALAQRTTSASSNHESNGWDNYTNESVAAPGSNVFLGTPSMATQSATNRASNESLRHFLSRDPSHTLGDDVFKLSHPNLPSLNYEESKTSDSSGAFGFAGQSSLAPGPPSSKNSFAEYLTPPEPRRESPSTGTGTTASSRSSSPYENGGGRTIQAYQPETRNLSSDSSTVYNSLAHAHVNGSHPSLTSLGVAGSPYGKEPQSRNNGYANIYEPQQPPPQDPNQPQVLYMAVPSPDGRGQVLQPVQMLQLPGKPYTYVVPGTGGSNAAPTGFIPDQQAPGSMMTLPPLTNGVVTSDYSTDLMRNRGNNFDNNRAPAPYDALGQPRTPTAVDDYNLPFAAADTYASAPPLPSLDTLLGQVRRLSRDQVGCRLVQQALDEEGPMAASLILNEGLAFWGEAMVDPFGNYLFQKILEKVTAEERVMLVKSVSTRLVNASLNLHGTRSVQKVVELCAQDEQNGYAESMEETAAEILTKALTPAAARLCIDSHGNHVIQRILLKLGPKYSKFVFDAVAASVGDVARHRHGCCVIQRCLDSPPNESRSHLVGRIVEKALELMQDAYGNYVVQYVLDVCSDEDVQAVCESVVGKVNLLAIQKFSSNVMEKCLERCDDRVRELYLAQMSDPDRIRELMMDPFGNYVVQRALSVATHTQAIRLVEAMRPHLIATQTGTGQRNGGVRNTAGGRRIIAKICRRFPNFTLNPVGTQEELYGQNKGSGHHHHRQQQNHNPHHNPHQQQPAMIQPYATVGGPAPPRLHYMNDPRLAQGHIPMQQQSFYSLGGNPTDYYQPQQFSGGSYPGM